MTSRDAVLAAMDEHQVEFVALWFTDITGLVKSVTIPRKRLQAVIDEGIHFDGSSIEGFARVAESDMILMPDLDTFTVLPWDSGDTRTARLICNVRTPESATFIGDPRAALIAVLKEAREMGFRYKTGIELEFFLFRDDDEFSLSQMKPHDSSSYFDMSTDLSHVIRRRMMLMLEQLGMGVDSAHHEIGSGQHEIDFDYNEALTTADQVLTSRVALKTIAQRMNLHCTFMPRPSMSLPGSGMHTHQSLHNFETDANVFADTSHEYGLSETARWFLAGQLTHARAMCAVLAPLVNSYKRIGVSFEAPIYVTWAHVNRAGSALIRVPHIAPGREEHTRLEIRCPDPSANPYLASAVMLAAGLDGIRQKLDLTAALEETLLRQDRGRMRQVEMLPTSLGEALDTLAQDDVILAALGPYISDRYVAAKRQELDDYNRQVTPWEIDRYLQRF